MVIVSSIEQLKKARRPSLIMVLGKVTVFRNEQPIKARSSI